MRYRISDLCVRKKPLSHKKLKARRTCHSYITPLPPEEYGSSRRTSERINIGLLFEQSVLPEARKPRRDPLRFVKRHVRGFAHAAKSFAVLILKKIKVFLSKRQKFAPRIGFYSGVLCSAILCAVLSAAIVLFGLFGRFLFSSDTSGSPLSQSPDSSLPVQYYTVENFCGMTEALSTLSLKNKSIVFFKTEEYSDTVPEGHVISTSPSAGGQLYAGQPLTLKISLGKKLVTVRVPELYGLGEAGARALLSERGLTLGNISYKTSARPYGTVIEQNIPPYNTIEKGTAVDITVSLGSIAQKKIPDLYGMTEAQAKEALASCGLVIGGIFSTQSAAPKGTVVVQAPIAGTPITSSITSVDIYLSS